MTDYPCIHSTRIWILLLICHATARAQPLGEPDRAAPGDRMVQNYLAAESIRLESPWSGDVASREAWQSKRAQYEREYLYMLGLQPMPARTPLHPTVTGSLSRDDYVVDMLHYQSRPGLYVTANLYRPARVKAGDRLPAVLYLCGHSNRGRNGNKVAYQSHGIWFARHGYICLMVDTLQLGEIAAFHHGTYNLQRWWWHSRGYTPAGVEAWNGIRGIDYLVSRPDVDADRIAVTGISGGGAATFWVSAADPRVAVAVPVSGMADLESYVSNRVINGHCDCMFLYNTFQWPWTRIAGLIAPRPLLFVNSDHDSIFPMDANDRVINRLERLYSLYGAGDRVDAVVSVGDHAYRKDIRQAAFGFIQRNLRGDAGQVFDSEVDLVSEGADPGAYPIPPESLRVFPNDTDLPRDQLNTRIDEIFVPTATVPVVATGQFEEWKRDLIGSLREVCFGHFPEQIPPARKLADVEVGTERMQSEDAIEFYLRFPKDVAAETNRGVLLVVLNEDEAGTTPAWVSRIAAQGQPVVYCEPRGVGATSWTRRNPPNYVERAHALLGRTVDSGRVWDVIAAAQYVSTAARLQGDRADEPLPVLVAGRGAAGVIAAYAAVCDDAIAGVTLVAPHGSHLEPGAPQLLNVLRVCDIPESLGLIAPRPLRLLDCDADSFLTTAAAYAAASAPTELTGP